MSARFITGDSNDRGRFYAAVDPTAHHVEPGVPSSRLAAFWSPFRSRQEAERALIEAGTMLGDADWGHG